MTTFLSAFGFGVGVATVIVFAWPWVSAWLERRDQPQRLLRRVEAEWRRELDSVNPEDQWNW